MPDPLIFVNQAFETYRLMHTYTPYCSDNLGNGGFINSLHENPHIMKYHYIYAMNPAYG